MAGHITTMSGYTEVLTEKHCPELQDLVRAVKNIQYILDTTYAAIVEKYDKDIYAFIEQGLKQGNFRDAVTKLVGKPYARWDVAGPKSRYWRMLTSHIYQQYASRYKRKRIIDIIKDGGYVENCAELRDDLGACKLYPKDAELVNIFKFLAKGNQQQFKISPVILDFTTGDNSNIFQEICGNKVVVYITLGRKQRFKITYQIPPSIQQLITKTTKPMLSLDNNGDVLLRYCVETVSPVSQGENILGVDLGKIKKFSASALSPSGLYSQELSSSRELHRSSIKEKNLIKNKDAIYRKKEHLARLIKECREPDQNLIDKYELLDREYHCIRSKLSHIKEHSSWLVARDVVIHALEQDCSSIHLEKLSWVSGGDNQGKWDYSLTQEKVAHKAGKYGIAAEIVNAAYTSREYPEPYSKNPAPLATYDSATRELVNIGGNRIDRDYAASIAIAARNPLSKCKGKNNKGKSRKRAIQPAKCRDKDSPTPKRAKKKIMRTFAENEKRIVENLLAQGVSVNGFLLSLSRSVVASDGVANKQPSLNGDHVQSEPSTLVT